LRASHHRRWRLRLPQFRNVEKPREFVLHERFLLIPNCLYAGRRLSVDGIVETVVETNNHDRTNLENTNNRYHARITRT